MMVIAVGSGERIGRVLPELGALLHRPLFTLERVHVCKRDGQLLGRPRTLPGADEHGMALWQKLMIYTSEGAQHDGQPIHCAIIRRLRSAGISGATTVRGIWGFDGDHAPHGDRILQLGRHVPAVTIVIDTPERISAAFSVVDELTSEGGLVTSETIPAMRASTGDRRRGGPHLATHHLSQLRTARDAMSALSERKWVAVRPPGPARNTANLIRPTPSDRGRTAATIYRPAGQPVAPAPSSASGRGPRRTGSPACIRQGARSEVACGDDVEVAEDDVTGAELVKRGRELRGRRMA